MDPDDALCYRLAKDLDEAFPALVEAHAGRLYTIAHRTLGVPSDAEEVAQDALVRAHAALGTYDADRIRALRLKPWLATIAVNLARNRRRRATDRRPPTSLEPLVVAGLEPRIPSAAGPLEMAERRDARRRLADELLRLPPAMREAIVLRHVDGLSVAETALALGRPEGTVKAQVHRGLAQLRLHLAPDFLDPTTSVKELTA
ncbi:MAG: RNA polymerase sigma factor [Chloroflexi bacterium]|nr:RNA polymerase sigma factor [Chloroflexota bacterium]